MDDRRTEAVDVISVSTAADGVRGQGSTM